MTTKHMLNGTKQRPRNKSEWNLYLTDDDKFKLSKEEVLRRKKLYISKHNILTSSPNSLLSVKSPKKVIKRRVVRPRQPPPPAGDESDDLSTSLDDITSLDILTPDDEPCATSVQESAGRPAASFRSRSRASKQQKPLALAPAKRSPAVTKTPKSPRTSLSTNMGSPAPVKPTQPVLPSERSAEDAPRQQPLRHPPTRSRPQGLTLTEKEMLDIGSMVESLHHEVAYYEQLTGKKSAIDVEELKLVAGVTESQGEGTEQWAQKSPVTVMRYLVHVVCQSMSHLLQGEVERATQREEMATLSGKVDQLMALNTYQKPAPTPTLVDSKPSKQLATPTPSTPVPLPDSGSTPLTDRTVDLYSDSAASLHDPMMRTVVDPSSVGFDTPVVHSAKHTPTTPSSSSMYSYSQDEHRGGSGGEPVSGQHKVRFRLDPADDGIEQADSNHSDRLQLGGTATSDWLFSSASSLASADNNSQLQTSCSEDHVISIGQEDATAEVLQFQHEHQYVTPPRPPASTPPGSARVQELQRQLAMIRQQPSGGGRSDGSSGVAERSPHQPLTPTLSSSRPPVSTQLQQAAVKIPAVKYTSRNRGQDLDRESGGRGLHRDSTGHLDMDGNEGVSYSSIPAQYLPTPEKQPSHPFYPLDSFSSPDQQSLPVQYSSNPVYDARKGAFSAY